MVGVILAAGKGTRLAGLPTRLPKAVLPVLNLPIAYTHLIAMAELGIEKAYVVVGHRGFEVVREIERQPPTGVEVVYVDQEQTLGLAHSVGRLEAHIQQPFLLFLGDIYFRAPRLGEMKDLYNAGGTDAVLGARQEPDFDELCKNFVILNDENGRAVRVIEKPRHPPTRLKGVGVYLFSPVVFDAIRRTPRTAMRDEYEITESIQIMIDDGHCVRALECIDEDLNVTFPKDLLDINLHLLAQEGGQRRIASGARVAATAAVERAIVGTGAEIGENAVVRDSVVFAGGVVPAGVSIRGALVTEQAIFPVRPGAADEKSGAGEA